MKLQPDKNMAAEVWRLLTRTPLAFQNNQNLPYAQGGMSISIAHLCHKGCGYPWCAAGTRDVGICLQNYKESGRPDTMSYLDFSDIMDVPVLF